MLLSKQYSRSYLKYDYEKIKQICLWWMLPVYQGSIFMSSFHDMKSQSIKKYVIHIFDRCQSMIKIHCDALRNLVPFVQFKKCEKHPWRSITFSKVVGWIPATSLKVTLLHGCFSRFLNCTNGTKSRKTSQFFFRKMWFLIHGCS